MKYLYIESIKGHFFDLELTISHETYESYIMIHSQSLPVPVRSKDRGRGVIVMVSGNLFRTQKVYSGVLTGMKHRDMRAPSQQFFPASWDNQNRLNRVRYAGKWSPQVEQICA